MATPLAVIPPTFTIEPFDATVTTWTRWHRRLEGAFEIFQIPETQKVKFLLHYIGSTTYNILADQFAPRDSYDVVHKDILQKLQEFYEPKPLEIAENYRLMQRKQQDGELAQDFAAALQNLSLHCSLGEHTKTTLRNYFTFGLKNKRIQNRLMEMPEVDLDRAIQVATTMELSEKGTKQVRREKAVATLGHSSKKQMQYKDKSFNSKKLERGKFQKSSARNYERGDRRDTQRGNHAVSCFRYGKNHYASKCTLDRSIKYLKCGNYKDYRNSGAITIKRYKIRDIL